MCKEVISTIVQSRKFLWSLTGGHVCWDTEQKRSLFILSSLFCTGGKCLLHVLLCFKVQSKTCFFCVLPRRASQFCICVNGSELLLQLRRNLCCQLQWQEYGDCFSWSKKCVVWNEASCGFVSNQARSGSFWFKPEMGFKIKPEIGCFKWERRWVGRTWDWWYAHESMFYLFVCWHFGVVNENELSFLHLLQRHFECDIFLFAFSRCAFVCCKYHRCSIILKWHRWGTVLKACVQ